MGNKIPLLVAASCLLVLDPLGAFESIHPGEIWPDDRGQHVQAHGGGIIRWNGTYFWFGEFVWTGFDYLGEPTPYDGDASNLLNFTGDTEKRAALEKELKELGTLKVPSRSSYFGVVDLAGFPKDRYYLYQGQWRKDLPMAHILPHWNWPERVGQATPIHVYTSGDEAELFVNGRSQGRRKLEPGECRLRWDDIIYEPGEVRVVGY